MKISKYEIKEYKGKQLITVLNQDNDKLYYYILDVLKILRKVKNLHQFEQGIKRRDVYLRNNWYNICKWAKIPMRSGCYRKCLVADKEGILRILEAIPENSEVKQFKEWLCEGGEIVNHIEQNIQASMTVADNQHNDVIATTVATEEQRENATLIDEPSKHGVLYKILCRIMNCLRFRKCKKENQI